MSKGTQSYEAADIASGAWVCVKVATQRMCFVALGKALGGAVAAVATMLSLSILTAAACGAGDPGTPVDDAGILDAATESIVHPSTCRSPGTICDGFDVRACDNGRPGDVLETCPEACSFGRCTSQACFDAEKNDGLRGCRFYGVQMDNIDSDDAQNLMLILDNDQTTATSVVVKGRNLSGEWEMLTSAVVPGRSGARMLISRPVLAAGLTAGAAFRVDSDGPVTVGEVVSGDDNGRSRSSGGTMLRPLQALGMDHLAITFPQKDSLDVAGNLGSRGGAGAITIVATAPNTQVSIGLTGSAAVDSGGMIDSQVTAPQMVSMQEGDVLQIFSAAPDGDLTGTTIDADAPLAVFSGNVYTTYGMEVTGWRGGDLATEQLPPTFRWATEYVGARLSPQAGCYPWFAGSSRWSVVASDTTMVMLTLGPDVSIVAADGGGELGSAFQLTRGQSRSFVAQVAMGSSAQGDFVLKADPPVLLAQWLDCQPALSWGIDTRFVNGPLAFTLPPGFKHEIVVVTKLAAPLSLDGRLIATSPLEGTNFSVVRLSDGDLGSCMDLQDSCSHILNGGRFGISRRGMDVVCSYALTVPTSDNGIDLR